MVGVGRVRVPRPRLPPKAAMATVTRRQLREVRDLLALLLTDIRQAERDAVPHRSADALATLARQVELILERQERIVGTDV